MVDVLKSLGHSSEFCMEEEEELQVIQVIHDLLEYFVVPDWTQGKKRDEMGWDQRTKV